MIQFNTMVSSTIKTILIFVVLCISTINFSQNLTEQQLNHILETSTEPELVRLNTELIINKNYYHASIVADKLLTFNQESPNYNYRKGFSIFTNATFFNEAIPYFEIAITDVNKNYDMLSHKELSAPIDAFYYMGRSHHLSGKMDQAIEYYQQFLALIGKKNVLVQQTELYITQCHEAKKIMKTPVDYEVINVGSTINTDKPEYSPVVSLDGSALYFTSRRLHSDSANINIKEPGTNLHLEDVYVSYKDKNNQWTVPKIMDFCKPEYNEATVAVSTDERRIYVCKDETGNGDIYYSNFESSEFQELNFLEDKGVNTEAWETHITVSPDGQRKYFASDREGGYGGRDIYMIEKSADGNWSEPVNLGPTINTPHDEDAPFIAVDNKTMYFAHNGPKSMGGFDIFTTHIQENGEWSEPLNLGYPLNSTSDEIYYTTTVDGLTGYLTSYRDGGYGDKDIYEVRNKHLGVDNIAVLLGEIETKDKSPLPEHIAFTVKCLDCDDPYEFTLFPRISDGTFFASLYPCQEYEVTFHKNNGEEEISQEIIKTNCDLKYEEIYRRMVLDVPGLTVMKPEELIQSYKPLAMKHFFGYNKNKLDPEKGALKIFMDSLNAQIKDGRTSIEIEINSSASTVPTKTFGHNRVLAEQRAQGVKHFLVQYFKEKGISDSIELKINNISISGPAYSGDYQNIEKYAPFQYVELSIGGINVQDTDIQLLESKDGSPKVEKNKVLHLKDQQGDTFTQGEFKEGEYQYQVIVGIFERIHYAEGMVKSTTQKGFDAKIIGKRNGMHVVSAGSTNTHEEAVALLKRIRNEVIPSAWILNIKN